MSCLDYPDYLLATRTQAASMLGVSVDTLDRMHARGDGPERFRISPRRWGYRFRDIHQFIATRFETHERRPDQGRRSHVLALETGSIFDGNTRSPDE